MLGAGSASAQSSRTTIGPLRVVPGPSFGPCDSEFASHCETLFDVDALPTGEAWAVGWRHSDYQPLIEHGNGGRWRVVPLLHPQGNTLLYSIDMTSARDGWIVGYGPHGNTYGTVVMHWDGTTWTPRSDAYIAHGILYAVRADGPRDAWAVGSQYLPRLDQSRQLVMHWDGRRWASVPPPDPVPDDNGLNDVTVDRHHHVWVASGSYLATRSDGAWIFDHSLGLRKLALDQHGGLWGLGNGDVVAQHTSLGWREMQIPYFHFRDALYWDIAVNRHTVFLAGDENVTSRGRPVITALSGTWRFPHWSTATTSGRFSGNAEIFGVFAGENGVVWAVGRKFLPDNYSDGKTLIVGTSVHRG
jgi:hypothetical protein